MTVTESAFPWERDALDFVRARFPAHEPYRAWSNFEFIADDGSINEVDLLVFSPEGLFLIEIKSQGGRLRGDAGTWTWESDGRLATVDNPLILANSKAKKLRSLLSRQKVCKKKGEVPFIEPLVFCSAADLQCDLQGTARFRVCLRDKEASDGRAAQPGIMAAIQRRECPGLDPLPKGNHDRPAARLFSQAMEQAGVRPSQRSRRVSDYVLDRLIDEGPGRQDWHATHTTLKNVRRRVRIYTVRTGATEEERKTIERAARREAELLESLRHPGILRREGFTEHELGPALVFEHDPQAIRLDHLLAQRHDQLSIDQRLDLLRQIAEVVKYAHAQRVIHRGLCPQSVLVSPGEAGRFQVKVFNWQLGYREGGSSSGMSRVITATSHIERLVEDVSTAYMAPEAVSDDGSSGEHLDVFSLGAVAYHLFSGQSPAANGVELSNKLRETKGLQISSVLNGAGESLQELIQWSTHADVSTRLDTVGDFLELLERVEDEATAPDHEQLVEDPTLAKKDDQLSGGFRVVRRLGQGACSVVLLVARSDDEFVLKIASDPDFNARLQDEAEVVKKLRHSHIVELVEHDRQPTLEIGDRVAFLMRPVFANKEERRIETLRDRLQRDGRLHVDLLQRFGEDLLDVVRYLEEEVGVPHRDLKPDNIAIGQIKRGDKLHLVLFDFSLSRTSAENIRAGTSGYLDPLLPLRKPPRWDLHAERYAAAVTLYELAAGPGALPKWGDGASDPSHIDSEATIDGDLFDAALRDGLSDFFHKAFRRSPADRFDNAEQMLAAWRDCFLGIADPGALSDHEDPSHLKQRLASATFDTHIAELELGTRAMNALDRANVFTVEDLLTVPARQLQRLRGVGNKTRREISAAVRLLRDQLGTPQRDAVEPSADDSTVPVLKAWQRVRANRGAAGIDDVSVAEFEKKLKNNLYRIWNRMSSGSYVPPPVRRIMIPKPDGRERPLGIPAVGDRVAQMVVKMHLEPKVEPLFHPDSYGYRPGKSALDAVGACRRRCWRYNWVVDLDIRGFFDNIDHSLMMHAVRKHTDCPWVLLYIERWLKAPAETDEGVRLPRDRGTPQGGVASPLLANIFLHHVLDMWMAKEFLGCPFERYADDVVIHCRSQEQALKVQRAVEERLRQCKLEAHPEKTRIVYCRDSNRTEDHLHHQFDFLGYGFKPRRARNSRDGRYFTSFVPAIGRKAMKEIVRSVRDWGLHAASDKELDDFSRMFDKHIRGWVNYYGRYYPTALHRTFDCINRRLVRWAMKKYKRFRGHQRRATQWLRCVARERPELFAHWRLGIVP